MANPRLAAALDYARRGIPVLPLHGIAIKWDGERRCTCGHPKCSSPGKHPKTANGVKDATTDEAQIRAWAPLFDEGNIGIATGEASGIVVLDVDPRHGGDASLASWIAQHGHLPVGPRVLTGGGGEHYFMSRPDGGLGNSTARLGKGLDIKADGGYVVAAPSNHISGGRYEWDPERTIAQILPPEMPSEMLKALREPQKPKTPPKDAGQLVSDAGWEGLDRAQFAAYVEAALADACATVASAPDGQRNNTLNAAAFSMGTLVGAGVLSRAHAEDALLDAALDAGLDDVEACPTIRSGLDGGEKQPRDLSHLSRTSIGLPLNEGGNADRLAAWFADDLRYCDDLSWLVFTGQRWARSQAAAAMAVRAVITRIGSEADKLCNSEDKGLRRLGRKLREHARKSYRASSIQGTLKIASSFPQLRMRLADFDRDLHLLNVANGTIDLKTGELRPHRREDFITKLTALTFDPQAACPTWERFLLEIMNGDKAMVDFLQQAVGYSATGAINEHALFIAHGTGRNGKSVFLSTLLDVLGDYALETPASTLVVSKRGSGGIPNDVARLQRPHLVSANETDDGASLDEAKIKSMTGGDRISARFLYGEFFEYTPRFTPWLRTNSLPQVKGNDDGIWERLYPIPFEVTIPHERIDRDLPAKLRAELPGILAWVVRGAVAWYQGGLQLPQRAKDARSEYRAQQNSILAFLEWCPSISAKVKATEFYEAYTGFMAKYRRSPLTATSFGRQLSDMGWTKTVIDGATYRVPPADQVRGDEAWGEPLDWE